MKTYLQSSGQMAESSSVHDANIFQLWVKLEDHQARVAELEAEQGTTHAILQELSDTDRMCLCGKCLPCRAYAVLNPIPE